MNNFDIIYATSQPYCAHVFLRSMLQMEKDIKCIYDEYMISSQYLQYKMDSLINESNCSYFSVIFRYEVRSAWYVVPSVQHLRLADAQDGIPAGGHRH